MLFKKKKKVVGEGEKGGYLHFPLFTTVFSKSLVL